MWMPFQRVSQETVVKIRRHEHITSTRSGFETVYQAKCCDNRSLDGVWGHHLRRMRHGRALGLDIDRFQGEWLHL